MKPSEGGPRRHHRVTDRHASRALGGLCALLPSPDSVSAIVEVSANVSTNRVYLVRLTDGTNVFAKVSNYGSPFLFREDHDRILRLIEALRGDRWERFLAPPLASSRLGRPQALTYFDGEVWGVIYHEVERRETLPKILDDDDIETLAREMAAFHSACHEATKGASIPRTSTSITSDVLHLLDLLSEPSSAQSLCLPPEAIKVVWRHANRFLLAMEDLGYADMDRIPVFVDWNLGNFSIERSADGRFTLFSRWDYDWFRIDSVLLDFYFLSRVSSATGDRSTFSYGVHTLNEPRFHRFLAAYHEVRPLAEADVEMLVETYRFFVLHYVISVGDHFFRRDLWDAFRMDGVLRGLPSIDGFDRSALLRIVR